jgi:hypothetical protein
VPVVRDEMFKEMIVEAYIEGMLIRDIIEEYEVSSSSIYKWLSEFAVERTQHRNRVYTFDENYFEEIDTKDKAYWLGVLMSQGSLMEFRYTIKITAPQHDKSWLKQFLNDIGSTDSYHKISGSRTYYSAVRSKKTFEDLKRLGVKYSKPKEFMLPIGITLSDELLKEYTIGWDEARG